MQRYRIWFKSALRGYENSGALERADSAEQALEMAHARGIGWGLGYDPTHQAIALPDTHYHGHNGESTVFSVMPCSQCSGSCCSECSFKGVCEDCCRYEEYRR